MDYSINYFKYIYSLIPFSAIFLLSSCSEKKTEYDSNNINLLYTLSPIDTVDISIDKKTKPFHFTTNICYEKSNELLYFTEANRIDFYDINIGKLKKRIEIPFGGPNGVGSLEYIRYISPDTLFVKGKSPFSLYQFNNTGKKLRTFDLTKDSYLANRGFYANDNSIMSYYNDHLYLYVNPNVNSSHWFFNEPLLFTYNCVDSSMSHLPVQFPKIFDDNQKAWIFVDFNPATVLNNNNLLLSYPFLDSLYVYNLNQRKMKIYSLKSVFQAKANEGQFGKPSAKSYYKSYQDITAYYFMMYDKFRDVYYRFVLHPVEVDTKNKLIALGAILHQKPLSIQIIDNKFNLIGETDLRKGKYGIDDFFVGKKGLYLSNNNALNENFDENKLSYTIFSLRKLTN